VRIKLVVSDLGFSDGQSPLSLAGISAQARGPYPYPWRARRCM